MRLTLFAIFALGTAASAQTHSPTGSYGNILHPGVPSPGALRAPAIRPSGAPRPSGNGGRIGNGGRRSFGGNAVYVPYPIYGSGFGFDNFYPGGYPSVHNPAPGTYDPIFGGYNPGPAYAAPYQGEPTDSTPTVIINQNFQTDSIHPQFRDYSNTPLPEPGTVLRPPAPPAPPPAPVAPAAIAPGLADDQPTIFMIALQDHTILPVIAYWVQGDTLNYISLDSVPNHISLAEVDRNFSKQLNAERHVPFALPAAR